MILFAFYQPFQVFNLALLLVPTMLSLQYFSKESLLNFLLKFVKKKQSISFI